MAKKKIFFVLSSLCAGGAERVYWLIAQYFDKEKFDVSLVILNSNNAFYSLDIVGLNVIDLKTIKASKSFFKLYFLLRSIKPDAVFSTGGQINFLVSLISLFHKIPKLIARETNLLETKKQFGGYRQKFWGKFSWLVYKNMDFNICQSVEIKNSLIKNYKSDTSKLVIIPNPVLTSDVIKTTSSQHIKKLIVVARLTEQKGHARLLSVITKLPENYHLSIVGSGPLTKSINDKVLELNLQNRVTLLGQLPNIVEVIAKHDLMVLSSFTEGFPNAVIESLSVGVPVVSFNVSGISSIIDDGFNGFIVPQGDLDTFKNCILQSFDKTWSAEAIKADVVSKFGIKSIVKQYENLTEVK
jgi:glycosyltransferase involved in cell wall biosynthesis